MYGENMYGETMYGENGGQGDRSRKNGTARQSHPDGHPPLNPPYPGACLPPGQPYPGGGRPIVPAPAPSAKSVRSPKLEQLMDHFRVYGIGCILYGILFAFCLYPGFCGISVPILSLLTMGGLYALFRNMGLQTGRRTLFYFICWGLLSLSSVLTGSRLLITWNTIGMLLLFLCLLLAHFCNTETWGPGAWLVWICGTPFVSMGWLPCFFQSVDRALSGERDGKPSKSKYIWLGASLSAPVVLAAVFLLASADAVFERLCETMLSWIGFPAHPLWFCLLLAVGVFGSYAMIAYLTDRGETMAVRKEQKRWEPMIGIAFLLVLTVVYVIFCAIQISCLFMGSVTLTEGYTYASYAREGYFQLLTVCLMNVIILLTFVSRFREHGTLKLLLTAFSACTLIMDASSAMRMILYVQAYQLTFLRILVLWSLVVIDILLAGCIVTIYRPRFPLFRYGMAVVTICYLVFSLARPDALIARYNVTHASDELDTSYLFKLSSDAIPILEEAGLLEGQKPWSDHVLSRYYLRIKLTRYEEMGVRDFNVSDYTAGKILEKYKEELVK